LDSRATPLADKAPPLPALSSSALFLDFDGTLAPIAATPDEVAVPPATFALLERLALACGGALAIVSGREIEPLDHFLSPLRLPTAGLHGAQWRGIDGVFHQITLDTAPLVALTTRLQAFADAHPGVLLERKSMSVALHYRLAPQAEEAALAELRAAIGPHTGDYTLQAAKMAMEIKPRGATKRSAIERFMREAPFAGRMPVFAGDDLTDEAGFEAIKAMGGLAIKIGPGPTCADVRLDSPEALAKWLAALR
jgi:trehalose 6-phosphate phosphatase